MALSRVDYDAQRAEQSLTTVEHIANADRAPSDQQLAGPLQLVIAQAMVAQAHALEEIAKHLAVLNGMIETIESTGILTVWQRNPDPKRGV